MGKKFLIDSNILLEYLGGILLTNVNQKISEIINDDFNISVINRIEILGHPSADDKISDFLMLANIHDLSKEIISQTIKIRKAYKIKLPDAIIAATALVNNFTLISRNTKDFKAIASIRLWNPYN